MKLRVLFALAPALLGIFATVPTDAALSPSADPVDFARDVLPILSNKCYACHGPDTKRKGLVRLDSYAGATRDLGGYRAIDPANLEKSEILARIADADDPMPPADSGKQLTAAEKAILRKWIASGGKYAKHWAFVPPRKAKPPAAGHPIDAFVGAKLRAAGKEFAAPAERRTLARRTALVLTGLPPEPEQLANFLADRSERAFSRYVDVLLASPRFGEHQAHYWLDAVRYGDTHGLHLDSRRGIYPYRDWVVRAFNENLPLDDFITWQLAGDLLPNPTLAQQVATGYVRMNPSTGEGGAIPAEFQAKNNFDRVETLGTVLLGMTLTCARCHTHKYDPLTQQEYYELMAFFNSTTESPLDGNRYAYAPAVAVPRDQDDWHSWHAIEKDVAKLLNDVDQFVAKSPSIVVNHARATNQRKTSGWRISKPVKKKQKPGELQPAKGLPGRLPKLRLRADQAVYVEWQLELTTAQTLHVDVTPGRGAELRVGGQPAALVPDGNRSRAVLSLDRGTHKMWLRLQGYRRAPAVEVRLRNPWQPMLQNRAWAKCTPEDRLAMAADPKGPFAGAPIHARVVQTASRRQAVRGRFTTTLVAKDLPNPRVTRVLRRGEYDLPTGDPLQPSVPAIMGELQGDGRANRLALAKWLTSKDHPLVARVLINRVWQRIFGDGLVRTPEDFGRQGEYPTHPALLDWLAKELQDSNWNLKHMIRLMVTSRTFRQHSANRRGIDDPANRLLARGPRHRLDAEVIRDTALWASGLLDQKMGGEGVKPYQPAGLWRALAHPASNTKQYVADKDQRRYRRSLYVYWKRTSPHPMMTIFDAPSREASCVRRSRTSTPLQSLGLLNENQRQEMAAALAERLLTAADTDAARIDQLFSWLACRPATPRERKACETLLAKMNQRFAGQPDAKRQAWSRVTITVLASEIALFLY